MSEFNENVDVLGQDDIEAAVDNVMEADMQDNAVNREFQADDALEVNVACAQGNFQYI